MAKFSGMPWDLILSAELFEHYKPDPEPILALQNCLPAARASDDGRRPQPRSQGAQKLGLKTAFVARPTEYGPLQNTISRPRATGTSSPRILAG